MHQVKSITNQTAAGVWLGCGGLLAALVLFDLAVPSSRQLLADDPESVSTKDNKAPSPAALLAEMIEKHGYRLEQDQVLRRIAPPFPEVRATYYRVAYPDQAQAIQQPPNAMSFFWKDEALKRWSMSFGAGCRLADIIEYSLMIKTPEVEGPADLLNKRLDGDWVIRPNASEEQVLQQFETILQKEFETPVRLYFAKRVRDVFVATGKFQFKPIGTEEAKPIPKAKEINVEIYETELSPDGGGGRGDLKAFFSWTGRWCGAAIVDETSDAPKENIFWHLNDGEKGNRPEQRDPELVLKNVAAQTGLKFEKQRRVVRRLVVEPIE